MFAKYLDHILPSFPHTQILHSFSCTHTHTHTHSHTHTQAHMHTHTHTDTQPHMYTHVCTHTFVIMFVGGLHTHLQACAHTQTPYTHLFTPSTNSNYCCLHAIPQSTGNLPGATSLMKNDPLILKTSAVNS